MIHQDTEVRFVSPAIGLGVFATRRIRKGTIVWIEDDLDIVLDADYVAALSPLRRDVLLKYGYAGAGGKHVLPWDHARYLNHSFSPCMVPTAYGFEICVRDVEPGDELRCAYSAISAEMERHALFVCEPEEGTFRTRVQRDDYLYSYRQWDAAAREAFARFNHVDQPLRPLIRPERVDRVSAVASGQIELDSCFTLYPRG
jgi:hypothetical protein